MYSPDSSISGAALTGLTSPTFTLARVMSRAPNVRRDVVTALGGAGNAGAANTASKPFFVEFTTPAVLKALPAANPTTGIRASYPSNSYELLIGKAGPVDAADLNFPLATLRVNFKVPAGVETAGIEELRSMWSFALGLLTEEMNDVLDTLATGQQGS